MKILKFGIQTVVMLFLFAFIAGCNNGDGPPSQDFIKNIARVEHNSGNIYTFWVEKGKIELERVTMNFGYDDSKVRILKDVPDGEKMWVKYIFYKRIDHNDIRYAEIHIHSEKDLNPGGWNHGKFGSGMNTTVE